MRTRCVISLIVVAVFMLLSQPATAELENLDVNGVDRIVYDKTNDLYWYPLLSTMTEMTKAEQYDYIEDVLNANAYGGIKDWKFATLEQIIDLAYSMGDTPGAALLGPGYGPPNPILMGPPNAYNIMGVNLFDYFQVTNFYTDPDHSNVAEGLPFHPHVFTGRTADEVGAAIEMPDGTLRPGGTTIPSEGEYHFPFIPYHEVADGPLIIFDDDLNWVSNETAWAPLPQNYPAPDGYSFVCSAWVVSETAPADTAPADNDGDGSEGFAGCFCSVLSKK